MYLPQEIIRAKRDGETLTTEQVQYFVRGLHDGSIAESQISAFAMAVYFQDMTLSERVALTEAMRDSGQVLAWQQMKLNGPVLDKHSTGGVGDLVSLMLGPIVACCGGYVPMISGRGLGHTGGTRDKFDAIPGYNTTPSLAKFQQIVADLGVAIIGQTGELAPADARFYATRDISATVESIPLITASILSKKLAAGLDGLVLDVKVGNGAVMRDTAQAKALAQSLVTVANDAGVPTSALLTDMNQPLARSAGNSIEVYEAIEFLKGNIKAPRLAEVTIELAIEMLRVGKIELNAERARDKVQAVLASGAAAERFEQMVAALGGPADILESYPKQMPLAPIAKPLLAASTGIVSAIDTRAVGMAVVALGGGRQHSDDQLDYGVGLDEIVQLGDAVTVGQPLLMIYARTEAAWQQAATRLQAAFTVTDKAPQQTPLCVERIKEQV